MDKTLKNDKKSDFGLDFGPFHPNFGHQIYLQVLPPLIVIIALGDTSSSKLSPNAIINEK